MDTVNWGTPPVGLFNFPIELWQKTGRFAELGLDLKLSSHLTGEEYGARIRAGAYDMGQIGTPVFLPAAVGSREYAVVSVGFCDFAPFYLVAAPGVDRLADCRGEKVVINKRMTCPGSLLEWHARQEGLAIDDFKVVELMQDSRFDNYGQAFADGIEHGEFRIGILYAPYVSLVERRFGWRVLADYADLLRPKSRAWCGAWCRPISPPQRMALNTRRRCGRSRRNCPSSARTTSSAPCAATVLTGCASRASTGHSWSGWSRS